MVMWKGKVTKELINLYEQYMEFSGGMPPDGYEELEGCYNISYDEFIGYIKECIKQKKSMPYIMFPPEEIKKEKKKMLERLQMIKEIYLQYITIFGKLPENYKDIIGDLSNKQKKQIAKADTKYLLQYIKKAIKQKEHDAMSDIIALILKEALLDLELDLVDDENEE